MASMGGLRRLAQRASDRAARHAGRLVAGQPLHDTHPHLLGEDEFLPGLTRAEFAQRRAALAEAMPRNSIAVLPGAPPQFVTGVIPHAYRQVRFHLLHARLLVSLHTCMLLQETSCMLHNTL